MEAKPRRYLVLRQSGPLRPGDVVRFVRGASALGVIVSWRYGTVWCALEDLELIPARPPGDRAEDLVDYALLALAAVVGLLASRLFF